MVRKTKRTLNIEMAKSGPCREFYALGYKHGLQDSRRNRMNDLQDEPYLDFSKQGSTKRKRPLNSWQKFVKANSNKRKFRFKDGKLKLKSMGIAYRKTAAYKRSKKKGKK